MSSGCAGTTGWARSTERDRDRRSVGMLHGKAKPRAQGGGSREAEAEPLEGLLGQKMLFSLQGPHRGARHAGPERPSCSLRVTKGPGATAEPHRAARAQHTLDSAIFTAGEGARREVVSGSECAPQHASTAPPR